MRAVGFHGCLIALAMRVDSVSFDQIFFSPAPPSSLLADAGDETQGTKLSHIATLKRGGEGEGEGRESGTTILIPAYRRGALILL